MTYLLTALLVGISLSSLMDNSSERGLFLMLALAGLLTSWWQQEIRIIRALKVGVPALLFILTLRAIIPFFSPQSTDSLSLLIKTWIYSSVLLTFIIYSPRDHYILQTLCLGSMVYSCFYSPVKTLSFLLQILAFFAVWVILLRRINISPPEEKPRQELTFIKMLPQELTVNMVLFLALIVLAFPLYLVIPRLDFNTYLRLIPEQKFSAGYADFPRKNLVSFLSASKQKLTQKRGFNNEAYKLKEGQTQGGLIKIDLAQNKPVFWHSAEQIERLQEEKKLTENQIRQINRLAQAQQTQENLKQRQELLTKKIELEKKIFALKNKDMSEKEKKQQWSFSFLELLISTLIVCALIYLVTLTFFLILPYLKEREKIRRAYLEKNYQLCLALLYGYLSRILGLFGFPYPVSILPEDHAQLITERLPFLKEDYLLFNKLFLEARYSCHKFNAEHLEKGLLACRNILEELKKKGVVWQRLILKLEILSGLKV